MEELNTEHQIEISDAREMVELNDNSVQLVVTSPPYPMIEMWDEAYAEMHPPIEHVLEEGFGDSAFEMMHRELAKVWEELRRVVVDGGIVCINMGDATRKVGDNFRVYQNASKTIEKMTELGFEPLPEVLWRKPVNSGAKFMGSGMLPPNAYVTLEHEHILVFRNGSDSRSFEPKSDRRYNSCYFWEERNQWFSDLWEDVKGESQNLEYDTLRERSAAYPFEIPYRLINMYSVYGDTVLDPFTGTGTTNIAAMVSGRNSVGYEIEEDFIDVVAAEAMDVKERTIDKCKERIDSHIEFIEENPDKANYDSDFYDFQVTTKQEKSLKFYEVEKIKIVGRDFTVRHLPFER